MAFRKFDVAPLIYQGEWKSEDINKFLEDALTPSILEFEESFVDVIFGQRKPTIFYFRNKRKVNDPKMMDLFKEVN